VADIFAEENYAIGDFGYYFGETSEPLVWWLEERVIFNTGLTMAIFHGDTLMRWDPEIIEGVVERIQYNYWISLCIHMKKLLSGKIDASFSKKKKLIQYLFSQINKQNWT